MLHNRKSPRLQKWDYSSDGLYFITICTKNRTRYFGEIHNGNMELSRIGIIANILWYEIKNHAKNIQLDEFIIMPDHIHGILKIDSQRSQSQRRDGACPVPTLGLGTIIGGYKSAVTKHVHRLGFEFAWQSRYHDHIIRDEFALNRIRKYIIDNPQKWWLRKSLSPLAENQIHPFKETA